ncbi:MAG: DUF115 domain-containing protein [Desulfarculales bacterium]|jgi:hypothetical protein|nr:DUF115 domain-containing protein [Desulfarculales bacterium]
MENKLVLFGAGDIGRKSVEYFGAQRIRFIIDNYKGGQCLAGVPVISYEDFVGTGYKGKIIVSVSKSLFPEIKQQLENDKYTEVEPLRVDVDEWYQPNPHLQNLRDIHKGKRCFIVGNGPSLTFSDLAKLRRNREISFGFNGVYKAFDRTAWRPTYFMAGDRAFIDQHMEKLQNLDSVFIMDAPCPGPGLAGKNFYQFSTEWVHCEGPGGDLNSRYDISGAAYPAFSEDPSRFIYNGGTVAYAALQFAVYMGVSAIYLLGVDLSYSSHNLRLFEAVRTHLADESVSQDHFIENYYEKGDTFFAHDTGRMHMAFAYAEKYSRVHGFRIYNAARGGRLEAFERVDFDSLFAG